MMTSKFSNKYQKSDLWVRGNEYNHLMKDLAFEQFTKSGWAFDHNHNV